MAILHRKLLRDLRHQREQLAAMCLVIACGVATLVMARTVMASLQRSVEACYERQCFAHVFCQLQRAPLGVASRLAALPGVQRVQSRLVIEAPLEVPSFTGSIVGRLIAVCPGADLQVNRPYLRAGRWTSPGRRGEVLLSEAFAAAHGLSAGDRLTAVLNGQRVPLIIAGIVVSPEYVFQIREGAGIPDDRRFAVVWISYDELAGATRFQGAFNDVALRVGPGTRPAALLPHADRALRPYGGRGSLSRESQTSHRYTTDGIAQLSTVALVPPAIFLAVAAFLLNMILSRLIATQRLQIATFKAFGYTDGELGWHYVQYALVVAIAGATLGTGIGVALAHRVARNYQQLYRFPELLFTVDTGAVLAGFATASVAALAGAAQAVRRVTRLPPAAGMRAQPPVSYRPACWEFRAWRSWFTPRTRMVLRQLTRYPAKAVLSSAAIGLGIGVMVLGSYTEDAIRAVIDFEFFRARRHDLLVTFAPAAPHAVVAELQQLPGVVSVEPFRIVSSTISHGTRARRIGIVGLPSGSAQWVPRDSQGRRVIELAEGLVISAALAKALQLQPGDAVLLDLLEGTRREHRVLVSNLVHDYAGLNAYIDADRLGRLTREGRRWTGATMTVATGREGEVVRALQQRPRVAQVVSRRDTVRNFRETTAENVLLMRFFNALFAGLIGFGTVYNAARVTLAERARELATLRAIGYTCGEVYWVVVAELIILTLLAVPCGLVLGYAFAAVATALLNTETQRIPLVIESATLVRAVLVSFAAALVSAIVSRRHIDRLDLLELMKVKD